MLKVTFELLINIIKKNNFKFSPSISSIDILFIMKEYSIKYLRGIFFHRRFAMIGYNCKIYRAHIGKAVHIDNNVLINGIGIEPISIGNYVTIGSYSSLKTSGSYQKLGKGIVIGDGVGIGEYTHIGGAGGVNIGENTIIGSYFSAHPENHNYSEIDVLIKNQGVNQKGIIIGKNCWIGAKVTILDGVEIGDGCVIAAGAVVNSSFPNNVVIAGVPARIIKKRF